MIRPDQCFPFVHDGPLFPGPVSPFHLAVDPPVPNGFVVSLIEPGTGPTPDHDPFPLTRRIVDRSPDGWLFIRHVDWQAAEPEIGAAERARDVRRWHSDCG